MDLVDEHEAMEPVSRHQQPAKNEAGNGPRHKRGASSTTALAHHVPAVTVRSPTASSAAGIDSRSTSKDDQFAECDVEDLKVEDADADIDIESARPVDVEDEDEEREEPGGAWSIVNMIPEMPWASEFAHGRPIDLSIQFTLWWMPFLVLLGWWTDRPMHLLFGEFIAPSARGRCASAEGRCRVRLLRDRHVARGVLPRELGHERREDEHVRGPDDDYVLRHDRACSIRIFPFFLINVVHQLLDVMRLGDGGVVVPRPAAGLVHAELSGLGCRCSGCCHLQERDISLRGQ